VGTSATIRIAAGTARTGLTSESGKTFR